MNTQSKPNLKTGTVPARTSHSRPIQIALTALLILALAILFSTKAAYANEVTQTSSQATSNTTFLPDAGGQVTLPLDEYQRLLQLATIQPLPSPSSYAVGQSVLSILFTQMEQRISATISAEVQVETFAQDWTLVPVLGPGAALESAYVNGSPVQLVQRAESM